nr:hypothetical protein [Tanacetum cinerariifolium]
MPRECLKINESKSKVRQSRAKAVVAKVSTSSSTPAISSGVAELKDLVRALLLDKKNQSSALTSYSTPASVKAVEPNCVTCGGTHSYQNCLATNENVYRDNIQESGTLPSNTITNPKEELKGITTRSGVAYQGPTISTPSKVVKQGTEEPEPRCIQNYNSYPHDSPSFPQQYPCCEDCGVTHEPYQCQPKNHDCYHEQNSCYDSNSIGFDQSQTQQYTVTHPIFSAHHDLLGSQTKLNFTLTKVNEQMTQLTYMCELACQIVQKNLEEKQLEEAQAVKAQSWKFPVCYDDDDDEEGYNSLNDNIISKLPSYSAVTPTEPINSLSMGDEHLDTILATKSDEFIKSCVENLVDRVTDSPYREVLDDQRT